MRTHHCNEIRPGHIGETVTLIGWVNTVRDQGGVIFIDLRDREGITQCVFRSEVSPEAAELSHKLRSEDVVQVTGNVEERLKTDEVDTKNDNLETGEVEIAAAQLTIVNKAEVLPFQLDKELSNEDLRLKHRYLDLRRPRLTRNLRQRHIITKAARDYLSDDGFIEVETPILSKATPEGARDFLVPSRINPGKFYALPQAPQQYKQMLMVAGVEKYFQIARCFRDEDLRADRQPEFSQIDIEASFVNQDDIIALIEGMLSSMFEQARGVEVPTPFERLTWHDAMNRYGSDKPERRIGMEMVDLTDELKDCEFRVFSGTVANGGVVKAINAKGFANISVGQVDKLTKLAQEAGAKGLAYIQARDTDRSTWRSPFVKRMTDDEVEDLRNKLNIEPGDLILFAADKWEPACDVLGRIRLEVAEYQNLLEGNTALDFLWVTEFPLLAFDEEEGRYVAVHHPFTRPLKEDEEKLRNGELDDLRAQAYDVVLNGYELGGGSIRIHESDLQSSMFKALGITEEEANTEFAHILEAFKFGAPPHGGIALGLDRVVMLACQEDSIREVIAFPKNNKGAEIMTSSPGSATPVALRDLRIKSTYVEKPKEE
ncbi:aspartate--tRNA ligase [Akkermansiaceae bacterium]|nr:aspartate--tRNA ligase [Verrucomicrobiota bacterium]MDA7538850.1 aspartate--tRNA ligase [Akkermansiaceae bacterium]MDA7654848.1 aspartate--tRNA ligase [Akkermansiaceae bacterium]MDB4340615.1 aspartate--tRNA ligase [Akkermansiaceae bacterium]MDB4761238.1 aspartate--tRNA ligase [Akkermansiaceae bacterium]